MAYYILFIIFSAVVFGIIRAQNRDVTFKNFLKILGDIIFFPAVAVWEAWDKYGNPLS